MGNKIVTVVGITGTQGSSVANHFLKEDGWQVRGITRNSGSEKAKAWLEKGVEIVQASLDDIDSLERAFEGSHAIFVVTDYVSNLQRASGDEMLEAKTKGLGKSIEAYAGDLEAAQGINAAKAASRPSVLSTLEKYIFSTLPEVTKSSGGQFTHAYEFYAKAHAEEYVRENLPQLNQRMSTVICGNYLENWPYITALAPQKEEDGSHSFLWLDCYGEHTAHPELWAIQDTGVFVKERVLDHPAGTQALACTAIIGSEDYAALWSKVMGLPAQHKVVSEAEYATLVPEEIRVAFLELIKYVTQYWITPNIKTPAELGIQATPLEEFIKSQPWQL